MQAFSSTLHLVIHIWQHDLIVFNIKEKGNKQRATSNQETKAKTAMNLK